MQPRVITISRQIGSGGSQIGQQLATHLGFRYIDREILSRAAQTLGLSESELEPRQERISSLWERALTAFAHAPSDMSYVPPSIKTVTDEELHTCQADALRDFASLHDCVIMGRAAHHVLRDHSSLLRVSLFAPLAFRVHRLRHYANVPSDEEARQVIDHFDRDRSRFLRHVTGHDWNCFDNYDICLDSSLLGIEDTVRTLAHLAKLRFHLPVMA